MIPTTRDKSIGFSESTIAEIRHAWTALRGNETSSFPGQAEGWARCRMMLLADILSFELPAILDELNRDVAL